MGPSGSSSRRWSSVVRLALAAGALGAMGATGVSALVVTPTPSAATSTIPIDYGTGQLMAADPDGGYWTATPEGGVTGHGGAPVSGSPAAAGVRLQQPVVGMAASPKGGYWLVASDGGIFSYGGVAFYGSTGSLHLNRPIVGMAATPDGGGYWLVASDGGIFSYGDAQFYGSTGAIRLNQPIVGMAPTPDGAGYWLVAADGGIFSYGDAQFYGSLGGRGETVLGLVIQARTAGYSEVGSDGVAHAFGPVGATTVPAASEPPTSPGASSGSGSSQSATTETLTTPPANLAGDPSQPDCQPEILPALTPDQGLNADFAGQQGPGWIGGDATYSTALPDGREDFAFSDTLLGTAQPDGAATVTAFVRNSELVGPLNGLSTVVGGSAASPQSLIPDTDSGSDVWVVSATDVEGGDQLTFVNEFVSGSPFDTYLGRSGIAVFSLPASGAPVFQYVAPLPTDPNTQWGTALAQSGGYSYIYGSDIDTSSNVFAGMKIARVPIGQTLDTGAWTYWNGSVWVAGEANAIPVVTGTVLTGVIALAGGSGFMAVSVPGGVTSDTTVDLSFSCSPTGPWSTPAPVYSVPQVSEYSNEIAYIPTFHPEIGGGGLVISYNIDTLGSLADLEQDVHAYQPQFLQLGS
jgi:hypothetical protein